MGFSEDEFRFEIEIMRDEDGYTGRECPECEKYFKLVFGTGIQGKAPCHCPYCGHAGDQSTFWTKDQIKYLHTSVMNRLHGPMMRELKKAEFEIKPERSFGIGFSLKVKGRPVRIHQYSERELETRITCDRCGLRYAVYALFTFCPDCRAHNSVQILDKNLDFVAKKLALADRQEPELARDIIEDTLTNVVAAFDGFGREVCRLRAERSGSTVAPSMSFQNPEGARKRLMDSFKVDMQDGVEPNEWALAVRCFQKRHLLSHKMGVVDQKYLDATSDPEATLGRKIPVSADEVRELIRVVRGLADHLSRELLGHPRDNRQRNQ